MKKNIVNFIAIALLFASCKKQVQNEPQTAEINGDNSKSINSVAARVINNKDMKDYLEYADNPEMTKLNTALYLYMSGMRKVFLQNTSCVDNIHNKIKSPDIDKGMLLDEFINGSGNCKTIFNNQVFIDSPDKGNFDDHSLKLINDMVYKGIGYRPVINLFNKDKAVLTNEFYMALLVETNEETNSVQDLIPAWHVKRNGTIQLELLDSWSAQNLKTPIYVFGYEPKANYPFMGGTILVPEVNSLDPETYNPLGRFYGSGPYTPQPASPAGNHPQDPPMPGSVVHEGVTLYAHHEQYYDSEYTICSRVSVLGGSSVWNLEEDLGKVPRNYIGSYYSLGNREFINKVSTAAVFSFLTYERDGWATFKNIEVNTIRFDFKASACTDIYVVAANASPSSEFPAVGAKTYNNGPANHIFRRY